MARAHFMVVRFAVMCLAVLCLAGCSSEAATVQGGGAGSAGAGSATESGTGSLSGVEEEPASEVISVDEGGFQLGEPPAETATGSLPAIVSLTGPAAVTNGGSATLHVQLSAPLTNPLFLVSLAGSTGYHTVPGVDLEGDGVYDISVQVSGDADARLLVLRVALTDGMGNVGPYSELELVLVLSGGGDVKITLSFDRTHDLDLHVFEPSGEEISYANPASATGGTLDLDSGTRCEPNPANSENVFWPPDGAPSGEYRVTVHNYEHCTPGEIQFTVRIANDSTVTTHRGSFADGTQDAIFEVAKFTR